MNGILTEKCVNPRLAIELAILHFAPNIDDWDLLDLRERIYYDAWQKTASIGGGTMYVRDYYLYSRNRMV